MEFNFKYERKKKNLEVKECKSKFSKMKGLMFRKNSKPLLFYFKKPTKQSIHSFFCVPFIIIWFDKNKIIEIKLVKPFRLSIKPKKKFDKFLEIPKNNKHFSEFVVKSSTEKKTFKY